MLTLLALLASLPASPIKVVTTLTSYAALAREITGDRATVSSIAVGDENPHYVQPKPSFVPTLSQADLFVTTGLDLELWVPALLDKANNPKVTEGGPGYVAAYTGIDLLDVPTSYSRSEGDIHVFGNPHIWTDPINAVVIARNILTGLKRVDPANADYYTAREKDLEDRLFRALYGDELVKVLGGPALFDLDRQGKLFDFLGAHRYQGMPLASRLGGWLKAALPFRRKQMVCYHKEWNYFSREFGIPCVDFAHSRPVLHELLPARPGAGGRGPHRGEGGGRSGQRGWRARREHVLRPRHVVGSGARPRVRRIEPLDRVTPGSMP